jgi:hypothetical protein
MSVLSFRDDPLEVAQAKPRRNRWRLSRKTADVRDDASVGELLRILQLEIYRSRRSGRRLALIGLTPPPDGTQRVGNAIRAIDHAQVVEGRLYLLLPETDRRAAYAVVARMENLFDFPLADGFAVAVFPEDALTAESLVARAADQGQPYAAPDVPEPEYAPVRPLARAADRSA